MVPRVVHNAEGISTLGVYGRQEVAGGSVIFVVTKLKVIVRSLSSFTFAHCAKVSQEYFSNLDANLMRLDHANRPELNKGTVDFVVSSEDYWAPSSLPKLTPMYYSPESLPTTPRAPQAMNYLFAFDVSVEAIESGLLQSACETFLNILYGHTTEQGTSFEPCFPQGCRIGILTFDRTLHFHNLSVGSLSSVNHIISLTRLVQPAASDPDSASRLGRNLRATA